MKIRPFVPFVIAAALAACARPEDDSFAVQAARRGADCKTIASGSAMDAFGHGVGPAEEIYEYVKQDCQDWYRGQQERLGGGK